MNIFGAFTFGSLIKTFLPGVVWLLAICLVITDVSMLFGGPALFETAIWQTQAASVLALGFLAAVLLGMLSNIVVFMGVNDNWVRTPMKNANVSLFALYDHLAMCIRDKNWPKACLPQTRRDDFDKHTDVEIMMLATIDDGKLSYVREQYWYHLEFQMNLLLSLIVLFIGASLNVEIHASDIQGSVIGFVLYCVLFFPIWYYLLEAAKKNYLRHISKMLSLMAGML